VYSRSRADSNRCTRFCRPLPSHSATRPIFGKDRRNFKFLCYKFQIPSTKFQTNSKFQAPNNKQIQNSKHQITKICILSNCPTVQLSNCPTAQLPTVQLNFAFWTMNFELIRNSHLLHKESRIHLPRYSVFQLVIKD
jgi:hypothetical protein